jgi:hypothetical protein
MLTNLRDTDVLAHQRFEYPNTRRVSWSRQIRMKARRRLDEDRTILIYLRRSGEDRVTMDNVSEDRRRTGTIAAQADLTGVRQCLLDAVH